MSGQADTDIPFDDLCALHDRPYFPNSAAALSMLVWTAMPNGQRVSQSPQARQADAGAGRRLYETVRASVTLCLRAPSNSRVVAAISMPAGQGKQWLQYMQVPASFQSVLPIITL